MTEKPNIWREECNGQKERGWECFITNGGEEFKGQVFLALVVEGGKEGGFDFDRVRTIFCSFFKVPYSMGLGVDPQYMCIIHHWRPPLIYNHNQRVPLMEGVKIYTKHTYSRFK